MPDGGQHGIFTGDEVAKGVGAMGAIAIGLVDLIGGRAVGIDAPGNFFEIANEFFAFGIDQDADIAGAILEAAVDAIDAVADERVGGTEEELRDE